MVIRDGHYRIFRDMKQKKEQMGKWNDPDENIPNKILDDYIRDVIDPLINKSNFGINRGEKDFFLKQDKTIRKMSQICYRLLNYILYSHLFFANTLGYISDEDMQKECLVDKMTCLEMMVQNWKLLEDALKLKNINLIQVFMNLIFKDLSAKLKECKMISKNEDREKVEGEIEKIIENIWKLIKKNLK